MSRFLTTEKIEQGKAMRLAGATYREIGLALGCSSDCAHDHCRPDGEQKKTIDRAAIAIRNAQIMAEYTGRNSAAVAARHGLSRTAVRIIASRDRAKTQVVGILDEQDTEASRLALGLFNSALLLEQANYTGPFDKFIGGAQ